MNRGICAARATHPVTDVGARNNIGFAAPSGGRASSTLATELAGVAIWILEINHLRSIVLPKGEGDEYRGDDSRKW